MELKELKELNDLLRKASASHYISDLDELGVGIDDDTKRERLIHLIQKAEQDVVIEVWDENDRGVSFRNWRWKHETYELAFKNDINLIDPE